MCIKKKIHSDSVQMKCEKMNLIHWCLGGMCFSEEICTWKSDILHEFKFRMRINSDWNHCCVNVCGGVSVCMCQIACAGTCLLFYSHDFRKPHVVCAATTAVC